MKQEYRSFCTRDESILTLNGEFLMSTFDLTDCPEDASLNRLIPHTHNILALIEEAVKHAQNGDEISFECYEFDTDEEMYRASLCWY